MRVELRDGDGMEVAQITTDAGRGLAQLIGPVAVAVAAPATVGRHRAMT